jgi:F-type H+-transporting ATPase subunit b
MTRRRVYILAAGVFLLFFVMALGTHAAEEGGNATTESATQLFKWINFAIVVGLLIWVCGKLTPPLFRKNADAISSAITKAKAAKDEADRQLHEAERKLANLEQEVKELRATAQREAAAEAERIRTVTVSDVQKVGVAAKQEIAAAERAARLELKAITANLAVDGAESLLVKQLTPQTQASLVAAFVQTLEGKPN